MLNIFPEYKGLISISIFFLHWQFSICLCVWEESIIKYKYLFLIFIIYITLPPSYCGQQYGSNSVTQMPATKRKTTTAQQYLWKKRLLKSLQISWINNNKRKQNYLISKKISNGHGPRRSIIRLLAHSDSCILAGLLLTALALLFFVVMVMVVLLPLLLLFVNTTSKWLVLETVVYTYFYLSRYFQNIKDLIIKITHNTHTHTDWFLHGCVCLF